MMYNTCISNKEALKDKIHEIHNYLRNNGAGYGMNALKIFNIIYGLKKIEENNLFDKVKLIPEAKFSYLLNLAINNEDEKLQFLIIGKLLESINESKLKYILYYDIPKNLKGQVFSHLIKEIDQITQIEQTCNVLLSGRDQTAISELGAYFTDRHIVDYIYEKLQPQINEDGSIKTMIDMFGGSGGFTTGYINYLQKQDVKIDWKKEINKIYHYDMNEDVIKSAGLEFFCLTGILPNKDNLAYKNSFCDQFNNKKFHYIVTNPPYGGDNNNKSGVQIKRDKVKKHIKEFLKSNKQSNLVEKLQIQLKKIEALDKVDKLEQDKIKVCLFSASQRIVKYAKSNKLVATDKESVSLIQMMDMLEEGGTSIGVLKEGIFFASQYKDIRRFLVQNFNVREIISVPQDQFENTSTKTSIIIFNNLQNYSQNNLQDKTSKVTFKNLIVNKYEEDDFIIQNDEFILTQNKGDIINLSEEFVCEATKEQILNDSMCSLDGKNYIKKQLICNEEYKFVKLGDICEFLSKSKRQASYGKQEGKYKFYTSSDTIKYGDECDYQYKNNLLIFGDGGKGSLFLDNCFSCSDHNIICDVKDNNLAMYIYSYLKSNWNYFVNQLFVGSVLKNLGKEKLKNFQIPIPKSQVKLTQLIDKISKPYDNKMKIKSEIKQLEDQIRNIIKNICDSEQCQNIPLNSLCQINKRNNKLNKQQYNYIEISDINDNTITNYTQLSTKELPANATTICDYNDILISCVRPKKSKMILITNNMQDIENYVFSSALINVKVNDVSQVQYIYQILYLSADNFEKQLCNGTTYPRFKADKLKNFLIPIPINKQLITNMNPLFEQLQIYQQQLQEAERQYKQFMSELSQEILQKNMIVKQV